MHNPQRDHGVAAGQHWLLDEELVPRTQMRVARPLPALLRHDAAIEPADERFTAPAATPSTAGGLLFALWLLAAFAIYLILRGADVGGALQGSLPGERGGGSVVVATTLAAQPEARFEARENAGLRELLGRASQPAPHEPETRSAGNTPKAPGQTDDPVSPLEPPALLPTPDPSSLLPEALQPRKVIEDLERATGLEPATLSLEG